MSEVALLKKHFLSFYKGVADCKICPEAGLYQVDGINRAVTGIPFPVFNSVMGSTEKVQNQIDYFESLKMPFMWGLDEGSNPSLFKELCQKGFTHCGIMTGVMGPLKKQTISSLPEGFTASLINRENDISDFTNLIGDVFSISGYNLECMQKANQHFSDCGKMLHFLIRKEGTTIAAVSIFIEGELATFWNGATLPEFRRHGLSTFIRSMAINEAIAKGCKMGGSYLMAAGMALGICKKFGYETKWKFDYFISPQKAS